MNILLFSRFGCKPKLPPGSKCTADNQCYSGNCRSSDVTNPHLGTEKYCGCDADSTDPKLGCKEGELCVKITNICPQYVVVHVVRCAFPFVHRFKSF